VEIGSILWGFVSKGGTISKNVVKILFLGVEGKYFRN